MHIEQQSGDKQGLITACIFDGQGGATELDWSGVQGWSAEQGILWVHFDYSHPSVQKWLREDSGLDEIAADAMLAEDSRPRSVVIDGTQLITLRGVNRNPGSDPEDLVSVRIWTDGKRILTARRRRMISGTELRQALAQGHGPRDVGEFLVDLSDRLVDNMAHVIDEIDDNIDQLEDQVLTLQSYQLRPRIADVRREAIALRRYLAPQREAINRLYTERVPWLDDRRRMQMREIADRTMRYLEDLDSARERAIVVQEELMSRLSEQMDKRMYMLSIVAAIFLPLGFLTGLLGINVGGIPGAEYQFAFMVFTGLLIFLVAMQLWFFKTRKWL